MDGDASFGHWLRRRRKALRLSAVELAQRVGCATVTLHKIEADERRPSEQIAAKLAEHLNLAPHERLTFIKVARAELGVHRLALPEQTADRPALAGGAPPRTQVPIPPTPLIGRAQDVAAVRELLLRSGVRLVSLTGAPGIGKTRLAMQIATELHDVFADGVFFIPLAPICDPDLVLATIAQALEIGEVPGQPLLERLQTALREKHMLLVLDNVEQVLKVAPQLGELLAAAPRLTLLVTSRVALRLSGEQRFTVPPLALPPSTLLNDGGGPGGEWELLTQYPAVALFVQRAQAALPTFVLTATNTRAIATICRRLDGLPLAIELAAVRCALFAPSELLAQLDQRLALLTTGAVDLPTRQQTLRRAIDWSYELLDAGEQTLFRRLGVFVGGCTLEAARSVCDTMEDLGIDVLEGVTALLDNSLLQRGEGADGQSRFTMLETLREYALDRLEASGEAEVVRHCHAEFFVEFAERVEPGMNGAERRVWFTRFDAEQENFRAALGWALATGNAELGLRLVGALGEYWYWWSLTWNEGWSWISQFLALPMACHFPHARATALRVAIHLLNYLGESAQANHVADESLSLFRELGDKPGTAWILADKGLRAWNRADYAEAVLLLDESITLFREIGDLRGLTWSLTWRAATACDLGQFEEAEIVFEASVTVAQTDGDAAMLANAYRLRGDLAYMTGNHERAATLHRQAMVHFREARDPDGTSLSRASLACIALAQGDLEGAAAQFEASEAWFREAQQMNGLCRILHHLGYVRHLQGDDRAANAPLREALTLQQQQQRKLLLTESLERSAWIAADMHQPQRAARLFGAAEAARERIGAPLPPGDRPMYDRHLAQARADLDETAFDAAWVEGRALSLDQMVAEALSLAP